MTYKCPKGHDSTDADYCSECGAPIGAAPAASPADLSVASSGAASVCPDCQTPRDGDLQFCEVCRYDFLNQKSFNPDAPAPQVLAVQPSSHPTPAASSSTPAPATSVAPALPVFAALLLVATNVDASLDLDRDPENPPPVNEPEHLFHLDLAENTVGRESGSKGIHPEIVVKDKSVSRRHLKFVRNADGTYSVLELGSANGTLLNGAPLAAGVSTPIKAGDDIVIGSWTRLSIRNR